MIQRIDAEAMSAIGPKRTWTTALHMSAFGGKADMTVCGNPLSRSLFGAKRTCLLALHMSAFDPKRTSGTMVQLDHRPSVLLVRQCQIASMEQTRANESRRHHPARAPGR